MGKLIFKNQKDKRKLLERFQGQAGLATIYRALSYQTNSKLAFEIRQYALANCNPTYVET